MTPFNVLTEMVSYPFMVRAILVGVLVSLCASLLGVSLVLKRYSMIGDGLSHVGFGSMALAMALGTSPLWLSIPIVLLAAFLLLRLSENSKIKGDAAIALISSSALAIGVMLVSLTSGMNTDVCNFMFGSILSLTVFDAYMSIAISIVVGILFLVFYPRIFAITFDETFARATGTKVGLLNMLLAALTAIVIVLGMRMMGALLISSLILFPALSAMRLFHTFKSVTICAAVISVISFMSGMIASYQFELPTGASIVCINLTFFLVFWIISSLRSRTSEKAAIQSNIDEQEA